MDVPQHWERLRLGDLADYINGRAFKPSEWGPKGLPIIRIQNLTRRNAEFNYYNGQVSDKHLIANGDLLISWSATLGSFIWDRGPAALNQHIFKVLPKEGIVGKEFLHFLILFLLDQLAEHTHGSTMKHITKKKFEVIECGIPPLEEQSQIVSRIQECFSRIEEMDRLQAEASIDAESFYGLSVSRVIEKLRESHQSKSVGDLVKADRAAMRSGPFGSAMKHDEFVQDGNLVIGIANVQANRFDPVRKWMISDKKYEQMERYSVLPGDVLVTIMGTIGRTCVVPCGIGKAITSKHVYRIRFPKDRVVPEYVSFLINFDVETKKQLFGSASGGVMPGLNATKLRDLEICLPPVEVQRQTVDRLTRAHLAIREMKSLDSRPALSELRNAILRQAFAGEL